MRYYTKKQMIFSCKKNKKICHSYAKKPSRPEQNVSASTFAWQIVRQQTGRQEVRSYIQNKKIITNPSKAKS